MRRQGYMFTLCCLTSFLISSTDCSSAVGSTRVCVRWDVNKKPLIVFRYFRCSAPFSLRKRTVILIVPTHLSFWSIFCIHFLLCCCHAHYRVGMSLPNARWIGSCQNGQWLWQDTMLSLLAKKILAWRDRVHICRRRWDCWWVVKHGGTKADRLRLYIKRCRPTVVSCWNVFTKSRSKHVMSCCCCLYYFQTK